MESLAGKGRIESTRKPEVWKQEPVWFVLGSRFVCGDFVV